MNRRLIEARKRLEMSQEELAACAGVHQTHISAIEAGRKTPSTEVAQAIAKALGVQVRDIFNVALVEIVVPLELVHAG